MASPTVRVLVSSSPFTVVTRFDTHATPAVFPAERLSEHEYSWSVVEWDGSTSYVVLPNGEEAQVAQFEEVGRG